MNNFYHDFVIGFNIWYVALPLLLFLVAFLGTRRYCLEPGTMRIKNRGRRLSIATLVVVILSDLTVTGLMFWESFNGLVQFITNLLAKNDSAKWALLFAFIALIIVAPYLLFNLFAQAVKVGEFYQLGRLTEKRCKIKKRRKVITFLNQNQ